MIYNALVSAVQPSILVIHMLPSRFSRVRLCVTPQTEAHQLPHPWDSPGKNTGVGCHFLLQCIKVESESEVIQSCLTLSDPMDCSPPGSSIHGIFWATVLEWGAIAFSSYTYIPSQFSLKNSRATVLLCVHFFLGEIQYYDSIYFQHFF